jgi:hypothetical protein
MQPMTYCHDRARLCLITSNMAVKSNAIKAFEQYLLAPIDVWQGLRDRSPQEPRQHQLHDDIVNFLETRSRGFGIHET